LISKKRKEKGFPTPKNCGSAFRCKRYLSIARPNDVVDQYSSHLLGSTE